MSSDPMHNKQDSAQDGDKSLEEWLSFAKTQAISTELLQFELDALAEMLEFKAKAIVESFEELVCLMQQHPAFTNNNDVSKSMSNMVRSLQFQDIAKQKLENISNALNTVHTYASEVITENKTGSQNPEGIILNEEKMDRVIQDRTLAEMRNSMLKNLEQLSKIDFERLKKTEQCSQSKGEEGTNVELF